MRKQIRSALNDYIVGAVDRLIGDITPPEELMKTLTVRKIAEKERVTYETQRWAEVVRKELQQIRAIADTQAKIVDSERIVAIAEYAAHASVKRVEGEAKAKRTNADAEKTHKIGLAEYINRGSHVAIEVVCLGE